MKVVACVPSALNLIITFPWSASSLNGFGGKLLDKCGFSRNPQNLTWVKNHGEGIRVFRGRC